MPRSEAIHVEQHAAVVVGTDFTAASKKAVRRAASIARSAPSVLHVVHASAKLPRVLSRFLGDPASVERRERAELKAVAAELKGAGVTFQTHWSTARASSALRSVAREENAGLVVVGSHGRTVSDAILGSTAEQIVDGQGPPVLLVRDGAAKSYKDVVIAVAVDSEIERAIASSSLAAFGLVPTFLHAYEGAYESKLLAHGADGRSMKDYRSHARRSAQNKLAGRLAALGISRPKMKLTYGDARLVLAAAAKPGSLLVIDRGTSKARHALLGSVSRWVIEHCSSDLLLV